jgi:DNA-binding MarR family transcriptional regulator
MERSARRAEAAPGASGRMTVVPIHSLVELARANVAVSDEVDRQLALRGIEPFHFGVLDLLVALGPVTPSQLADASGMRASTQRQAVQSLVDLGYVAREVNPADRRSHWLAVTDGGASAHSEALELARAVERRLARRLGWTLTQWRGWMAEVAEASRSLVREEIET